MKKILLATVFLLTLCVGVSRADIIRPGETPWWEGLDKLSTEEKLAECKELKRNFPDIEAWSNVIGSKKKWNMLQCDELLNKSTETTKQTTPDAAPTTDENPQTSQSSTYNVAIAGLLAAVLCAFACVLLWRARKLSARRVL